MAWIGGSTRIGTSGLESIDTAIATGTTLGTIVQGIDSTLGQGEFIFLKGVGSTVVGSLVTYNLSAGTTTLAPNTGTNLSAPVAVAMSANTATTDGGWYQIGGAAVIKKPAVKALPGAAIYLSTTASRVRTSVYSGRQILGARTANTTTITTTTSTVTVIINRPHLQGQIV